MAPPTLSTWNDHISTSRSKLFQPSAIWPSCHKTRYGLYLKEITSEHRPVLTLLDDFNAY
jgi:hypothetical protein